MVGTGGCLFQIPLFHPTTSSTKATTDLLEQDFAHFGYPHTIVSDNATTFSSEEFQAWCRERGIIHLTGAPYHPATNGAVERLVQTFKQADVKSSLPPKTALHEFLMQYGLPSDSPGSGIFLKRVPQQSPNKEQIDFLLPSPAHIFQGRQTREATKSQAEEINDQPATVHHIFKVGTPYYALYWGPRRDKDPSWVPAVVTKVFETRSVNVQVFPKGGTWRRHIEQLRPRYGAHQGMVRMKMQIPVNLQHSLHPHWKLLTSLRGGSGHRPVRRGNQGSNFNFLFGPMTYQREVYS